MSSKLPWDDTSLSDEVRIQKRKSEVLRLTLPPFSYSRKRIAQEMELSTTTIWEIRKELIAEGKLQTNAFGHVVKELPEDQIEETKDIAKSEFARYKSVENMIEELRKTVKKPDAIVGYFYKICKTLGLNPTYFLRGETEVSDYAKQFSEKFYRGESHYIDQNNARRFKNAAETSIEPYFFAIRSFRRTNGLTMTRGFLKVKSKTQGKYSKVKLSDSEREKGAGFMGKISSLMKLLFVLNLEIGLRIDTLLSLVPNFERKSLDVDGLPCEYFFTVIHEGKQEKGKSGGEFEKIIFTQEARDLVRKIQNGVPLYDGDITWEIKKEYNDNLREFYVSIGKLQKENGVIKDYKKGTEQYYYNLMPSHALRHSCVHWLLRCTDNDIPAVASMFWDGHSMLDDFYAKRSSIELLLNEGVCYYCNPPTYPDPNYQYFCKFTHALIYHNYHKTKVEVLAERGMTK